MRYNIYITAFSNLIIGHFGNIIGTALFSCVCSEVQYLQNVLNIDYRYDRYLQPTVYYHVKTVTDVLSVC